MGWFNFYQNVYNHYKINKYNIMDCKDNTVKQY